MRHDTRRRPPGARPVPGQAPPGILGDRGGAWHGPRLSSLAHPGPTAPCVTPSSPVRPRGRAPTRRSAARGGAVCPLVCSPGGSVSGWGREGAGVDHPARDGRASGDGRARRRWAGGGHGAPEPPGRAGGARRRRGLPSELAARPTVRHLAALATGRAPVQQPAPGAIRLGRPGHRGGRDGQPAVPPGTGRGRRHHPRRPGPPAGPPRALGGHGGPGRLCAPGDARGLAGPGSGRDAPGAPGSGGDAAGPAGRVVARLVRGRVELRASGDGPRPGAAPRPRPASPAGCPGGDDPASLRAHRRRDHPLGHPGTRHPVEPAAHRRAGGAARNRPPAGGVRDGGRALAAARSRGRRTASAAPARRPGLAVSRACPPPASRLRARCLGPHAGPLA